MEENYMFSGLAYFEKEILEYLKDGLTNEEIAKRMYKSPKTIEKHITQLLAKTGLKNRIQLAVAYNRYIEVL